MATGQNNPFFTPRQISGCQLWFDGADINNNKSVVTTGTTITNWRDKSGNGRNASSVVGTPVVSSNSTISRNGVFFNGTSYLTGSFSYTSTTLSWFVVGSIDSDGDSYGRLLSFGDSSQYDFDNTLRLNAGSREALTNELIIYRTQAIARNMFFTYSTPFLFSSILDGTNNTPFLNGTQGTGSASSGNFGFNTFGLSASFGLNVQRNKGFIFEVIVFSSVLTSTQRQQIEGYLAWKWNLQSSLPSTHPYKSTPIPPLLSPPTTAPLILPNPSFSDWSPLQISGCQLWLDATDSTSVTLNSTSVTQWSDKSGNARHLTQSTLANAPNYTRVGSNFMIDFVRANKTYLINASYSQIYTNFTLYMIIKRKAVPLDNERMFVAIPVGYATDWNTQTGFSFSSTIELAANGSGSSYSESSNLNTTMYSIVTSTNSANVYKNGDSTSVISRSLGLTGNSIGILLGSGTNSGINTLSEQFNGYIGEVILFTKALTTSERQQIDAYLALKWGLQRFLPASHPNKNLVPTKSGLYVNSLTTMTQGLWTPKRVSGLQLWLDAADINGNGTRFTNGASVSTWTDKSGNGYNATQGTSGNQPIFTGSGIRFYSTNQNWMNLSQTFGNLFLSNNSFHVFIVVFGSGSGFITGQVGNTSQNLFLGYGFMDTYQSPWWLQGSPAVADSVNAINAFEYTGSAGALYQNGTSYASKTGTLPLSSFSGPQIGRRYSGPGVAYHDHTFCEIVAYTGVVLTTAQRQNIEGYLAWKWGLQGSLPATHPFAKWPPSP